MPLALDPLLDVLRAIGEPTRLRIVLLLRHGELTVTDLTDILGQSQPRISRHLKVLAEAGVVDKHREGNRVFFELTAAGPIGELVADVAARARIHDPIAATDRDRLALVRARRAAAAQEYFTDIARRWDELRALHAADDVVEAAIVEAVGDGDRPLRSIVDLGTGTGRMLQLLWTPSVERAVGLDSSHSMLSVARSNFERAELRGIELRQGDVYSPPLEPGAFDLAIIHQVLHFLDDPARAVREAARLLAPGGRLVIVDFAPHALEFLRTDHAHVRLGFRADTIAAWLEQSGLDVHEVRAIDRAHGPGDDDIEHLTVSLWVAVDTKHISIDPPADALADHHEETGV
ncbi:MAG: metalloregulator ArsR/SmtB family transcription factor [Ilumatobacter sp.]|nr:metalloregulator ArsR/SmtB family transcription factor [Ilumatobacter sp.]